MLYMIDCGVDQTYWIQADRRRKALALAETLCGHDDYNECLEWDETLWGSQISSFIDGNMESAIEIIRSLGETVYTA
jgi:hypothetical protein